MHKYPLVGTGVSSGKWLEGCPGARATGVRDGVRGASFEQAVEWLLEVRSELTALSVDSCAEFLYCREVLAGIWKSTPWSSLALRVAARSRSARRILWLRPAPKSN